MRQNVSSILHNTTRLHALSDVCIADQNSLIFVQKSKMEEFKRLLNDGKVTIDSKFQYGQKDKTGRDRWIVFHDKDQKMFQVTIPKSSSLHSHAFPCATKS